MRDWYWKIGGRGPDYYFRASFRPSDSGRLARLLRKDPPKGFKLYEAGGGAGLLNQESPVCDYYFEEHRYEDMAAAFEGRLNRNVFNYELVRVRGHDLKIERAFGGAAGDGRSASEMLLMLARSPELAWVKWEVSYGGDGYRGGTAQTGRTGAELIFYLTGQKD